MKDRGKRLALAALVAAAGVLLLAFGAGAAEAACFSTPRTASFDDQDADGNGAPELLDLEASLDATCNVTVKPAVQSMSAAGSLAAGDSVSTYIDTDGNAATGHFGADRAVLILGRSGPDIGPSLGTWDGVDSFDFSDGPPLTPVGAGGFSATLEQLGVGAPATLALDVVSADDQGTPRVKYDDVFDFAPESPSLFLAASFYASPPVVAPIVPAALPAVTPAGGKSAGGCTVPSVKGRSVKKAQQVLAKAGCKYRIKGSGKVYKQSPKAGTKTDQTVECKAKKKKGKRRKAGRSVAAVLG